MVLLIKQYHFSFELFCVIFVLDILFACDIYPGLYQFIWEKSKLATRSHFQ